MVPKRAVEFDAWRIPPGVPIFGYRLDVAAAITVPEAVHLACTGQGNFVAHKDMVLVQRIDRATGQHRCHLFRIVKKTAFYRGQERIEPLAPVEVANWPVAEPIKMIEPPTTLEILSNPTGVDRTLIEGNR